MNSPIVTLGFGQGQQSLPTLGFYTTAIAPPAQPTPPYAVVDVYDSPQQASGQYGAQQASGKVGGP